MNVMVVVPAATPYTEPVPEPTVATEGVLLIHEPPLVLFVSVVLLPSHTDVAPPIVAGNERM